MNHELLTSDERSRELHLELLLSKKVSDTTGKVVGRIEEIIAQKQGDDWVIEEYLLGTTALIERLSAWHIGIGVLKLLGAQKFYTGYRVPWDKLDLSDPKHPKLTCHRDRLEQ
jgi:sporulation protein YlmC with PRC-barrel domain